MQQNVLPSSSLRMHRENGGGEMNGDEIFELRKKLGLTQTQLAERLGVDFVTVNRWENDHNRPGPRRVRALLALSGIETQQRNEVADKLRHIIRELTTLLNSIKEDDDAP